MTVDYECLLLLPVNVLVHTMQGLYQGKVKAKDDNGKELVCVAIDMNMGY